MDGASLNDSTRAVASDTAAAARPLEATPSASTGLHSAGDAAYCIAAWLSRADRDGTLRAFLAPELSAPEREVAQVERWILGIGMDHASSISPA
jgi:hypothetical protein